jgi:Protein of unknown function (DUF1232)
LFSVINVLIFLFVGLAFLMSYGVIPIPQAMRPIARMAPEQERWVEPVKNELSHVPPVERFYDQREYVEARPYRQEPIKIVVGQGKRGGGLGKLVVIACCLGYLLSPVDCISDWWPIIGWADDFVAGVIALRTLAK